MPLLAKQLNQRASLFKRAVNLRITRFCNSVRRTLKTKRNPMWFFCMNNHLLIQNFERDVLRYWLGSATFGRTPFGRKTVYLQVCKRAFSTNLLLINWRVYCVVLAKCLSAKCLSAKCLSAKCLSAKCLSAKCLYAKWLSAKCLYAKWLSAR